MTDRRSSEERRIEVVEAALELLADVPLETLSTRQLARQLGLSQPALFRHFRSREGILLAVVDRVRAELGAGVAEAVAGADGPIEALTLLVGTLLGAVERRPGLPRLLFSLASPPRGPVRTALLSLATSQKRLVQDLVAAGQQNGSLDGDVDAPRAATHLVGLVQGVIFQWVAAGRPPGLQDEVEPLMRLWLGGAAGEGVQKAPIAGSPRLAFVDGRELLGRGVDPLAAALDGLDGAGPGSVLRLDAPFHPAPLVKLLAARGLKVSVDRVNKGHFALLARVPPLRDIEDLRQLEAPEPLERALTSAAALSEGDVWLGRTPRFPRMLVQRLEERGLRVEAHTEPDGSALVLVWNPA